ncbi:TetR family transcriptional regulator [Arthrobacter sp. 35W]|uniref:TetR family transcriptional regulator n=1 Tax=Arthrobacter sp. 35W TaxID=1132441 RepID=UPI00047E2B8C|nr:TetR family transcriptional regulator [Arthrobacter sp. 35W]
MTPLEEAAASRRELNKAATREAIANAALNLLRAKDISDFTVDDVATAAGVSRRTFFNYFPSVEAAIASFTEGYLDSLLAVLAQRPIDEPVLESAQFALEAVGSPRDLAVLAETCDLTQSPQLSRFQLEAWDKCSTKITAMALERLGGAGDELYVHALVGAVVGGCRAAVEVWHRRHGSDTSPESLDELRQLLIDAVGHLRRGFAS